MTTTEFGSKGENKVCQYLEKNDYCIIKRNFKCSYGEIDIIATDKNELVFIEVKTRSSIKYGEARESVNKIKKKHIKKASEFYIYKNRLEKCFVRFDVIEVYVKDDRCYIKHLKNVLW